MAGFLAIASAMVHRVGRVGQMVRGHEVAPRDDAQDLIVFVDDAQMPQTESAEHSVGSLTRRWGDVSNLS
jgi:hypothetical protein